MTSPADALDGPALPRTVAGFRLIRQLGRGGMGVVYEAEEIASGRTVALKVLLHELGLQGQAFERFQREARLAAAISHSQCVFVYGAHEIDGFPAIAMELVGGATLEDKIRRGEKIPVETAVRWTLDILDGLEAAHGAGILHRDVKPSNCFVTPEDRVKIGDFGLSRSLDTDVQLTQSGQFLGSPLYASPEQIRGRAVDGRSDLYSCGATLYAVLSGKAPYGGTNVGEVLARILSEPPPSLRTLRPEIPAGLDRAVMRAMERDPDKRFRDIASFRDALTPYAAGIATPAKPLRRLGAYVIDWGLLMVTGSATVIVAQGIGLPFAGLDPKRPWVLESTFFRSAIATEPFFYFFLTEGFFGSSVGKWLLGQRVVAVATGQISAGRAALRAFVFSAPSVVSYALCMTLAQTQAQLSGWSLLGSIAVVLMLFSTIRRANGWRGVHEFASGTRVVQVPSPFSRTRLSTPPPETAVAPAADLPPQISDYRVEGVVGPTPRGRMLQAQDESLGRRVWIHVVADPASLADEARRTLARPTRLRWLDAQNADGNACDVFESPGGSSLVALVAQRGPLEWPLALRLVTTLVDELADLDRTGGSASLDQVWVDKHWNLRLLDEPVAWTAIELRTPVPLVSETLRMVLLGAEPDVGRLPPDLPMHAEPVVRRMLGLDPPFEKLSDVREGLVALQGRPAALQRRSRGAQLAMNTFIPALAWILLLVLGYSMSTMMHETIGSHVALEDLAQGQWSKPHEGAASTKEPLTDEGRRAREIVLARSFSGPWGPAVENSLTPEERASIASAKERHPDLTEADGLWADDVLRREGSKLGIVRNPKAENNPIKAENVLFLFAAGGLGLWCLVTTALALFMRGGLTLTLFGMRVRDSRGRRASRLRCLLRTMVCWAPMFLGAAAVLVLVWHGSTVLAIAVAAITALAQAAAITHALVNPAQSLADRIVGTRLVPR